MHLVYGACSILSLLLIHLSQLCMLIYLAYLILQCILFCAHNMDYITTTSLINLAVRGISKQQSPFSHILSK